MKKLFHCFIVSLLIIIMVGVNPVFAVSPEETGTPPGQIKKEDIKDKIEDLKERVATRVAELRAKSKRAFFGEIRQKGENSLILAREEKEQTVIVDKETTIIRLGPTRGKTVIDLAALEVGERLVAFGALDLDQKTLLAKRILAHTLPKNVHGQVKEVDIDAATITISQNQGLTFVIDYEIKTKCRMWRKGEGLVNCGLSKIQIGDRVFVRGTVNEKESNRLTALRLLILPGQTSPPPLTSPTTE